QPVPVGSFIDRPADCRRTNTELERWRCPLHIHAEVANRAAPGYDTEAVVAKIRELNNVPADGVLAGQALQVPSAP
ncbi:hypothetical protein ACFQ1S_47110, partial [Kibdelosporangium lantanae]